MDNFLSCWTSNTLAFAAVISFLNVFLCDATGLQCDLLTQNPVESENGIILRCLQCRPCNPGHETYPPCGTTVGLNDPVGLCHVCKNGFYSIHKDTLPCQPCRSSKCGDHEIPGGTCLKDQPDQSNCTGRCGKGYSMNSKRLCELDQPAVPSQKSAHLSDGEIVAVVVVVILICLGLSCLYWYFKCKRGPARRHGDAQRDCEGGPPSEGCEQNGLSSPSGLICSETTHGYGDSQENCKESSSVDNINTTLLTRTRNEKIATSEIEQECQQNGLPTPNGLICSETTHGYESSQNDVSV